MALESEPIIESYAPDPAAIFACAYSLWESFSKHGSENGMDQFMRDIMCAANLFESWACAHIVFEELEDVWPYLLQDRFGSACISKGASLDIADFNEKDCLRAAISLRLPIRMDDQLPIPVNVTAPNPFAVSGFREFRIQTVRDSIDDDDIVPFVCDDDPFDTDYGPPYFALYGIDAQGSLEHIADRKTYSEAVKLAQKLAREIDFPTTPRAAAQS